VKDNERAREKEAYSGERRSLVVVVVVESSHWNFGSLQMAAVSSCRLQPKALILYNNFDSKINHDDYLYDYRYIININSI
jgi:hypothetical protein